MPAPPLRILFTIHTPWDARLGGPRPQMELARIFRSWGHEVEKFSYEDAFPRPGRARRARPRFLRPLDWLAANRPFSRRAIPFVRRHGGRFDIIEANQTDLPCAKSALGFRGLLVARSVGLVSSYDQFERWAHHRWPEPPSLRNGLHRLLTASARARTLRESTASFRHADLINVSSTDDLKILRRDSALAAKVFHEPLGISRQRRTALRDAGVGTASRLAARRIAFIGTWNHRKGAKDWPAIVAAILDRVPNARFRFLGTSVPRERIVEHFAPAARESLEVIPSFAEDALPGLLADCTVGAFPGYLEGFGLGTLELLAAGLPTVAYDAPGSRDILAPLAEPLTVERGQIEAFAKRIASVLTSDPAHYEQLRADATAAAASPRFDWESIAKNTLARYLEWLQLNRP